MPPQRTIAHYRITSKLGEGGMGAVYRATDTKLNRDVALKVLPDSFAADPDRLARFTHEAQVLASLNHTNIAAIYGVEEHAIVMELVEGHTLAGSVKVEEALPLIHQFIDALEYAHEKGVIHRDLKPANIIVTPEGHLKVLDFGLAKALSNENPAADPTSSATLTMRGTMAGMIMGTAAYMSPEQARGHSVDKRADIWAFGVVVCELLTGKPLFDAPTVSDTLAAVLRQEPDLTPVPVRFHRLLRLCLTRDPRRRLRDIGDARALLDETLELPASQPPRSRLLVSLAALAAASTLVAAAVAFLHFREQPPAAHPVRFEIQPPAKSSFSNTLSVSPDGHYIAFIANLLGERQIWIRAVDSLQARPLPGTAYSASALIWSPDSRFLLLSALSQLKKIDVSGGPPQTLCSTCPVVLGGSWNREGVILVSTASGGIVQIDDTGGQVKSIMPSNSGVSGSLYFLRDGRHFLYARRTEGQAGVYLGSLDLPSRAAAPQQNAKPLVTADEPRFVYAPSEDQRQGHILFHRANALMAQPFDGVKFEPAGQEVPVAEDVVAFGASGTGVLAYRAGNAASGGSQLLWFNRQGKQLGQLGPPGNYGNLNIGPNGKSVIVDRTESSGISHIWAGDPSRGVLIRLNTGDSAEVCPQLLPDGRVLFTGSPPGVAGDLYATAATGDGAPEPWLKSENIKHLNDISPDGRFLIYDDHNGAQRQDLWIVPVETPAGVLRKPIPFLTTSADESFGQFSPDGKWIAYNSDESGRREIYVRGFEPGRVPTTGAGKWVVSTAGGDKPRWRRDGREIFYLALDGKMMAVPVKTAPSFEPGLPIPLFDVRTSGFFPYAVTADGRFLINTPITPSADMSASITVVLNWTAGLNSTK